MKGREQGEGKEKEMETSTLSGLSRQRCGPRERRAPDSGRGGRLLSISSSTAPAGRLGFQIHFQGRKSVQLHKHFLLGANGLDLGHHLSGKQFTPMEYPETTVN